ncbi:MAG: class I SAM-dependent methyltransferase [Rhodocyclaceae bacterium]|nr:class I SAM-dependent methyltransferase [Rhodocyclaceae bacterium]
MFGKITRLLSRLHTAAELAFGARPDTLAEARRLMALEAIADPTERRNALFEYLNWKAMREGFEIYNKNLMWQDEPAFWDIWNASPYAGTQRPDRKFVLWSMARSTRHLPGDTAECGVLDGASSYLICSAREDGGLPEHHAFDSFEGLSSPGPEDRPRTSAAFHWAAGDLSVPIEETLRKLGRFGNIRYHRGWIPQRFGEVATRRFSFVHVDVDLYQPTKDSLAFFYPRLVPGGILLCDDYGYHTCPGARRAFDEFAATTPERAVVHLPTGQGFLVKGGPAADGD